MNLRIYFLFCNCLVKGKGEGMWNFDEILVEFDIRGWVGEEGLFCKVLIFVVKCDNRWNLGFFFL